MEIGLKIQVCDYSDSIKKADVSENSVKIAV